MRPFLTWALTAHPSIYFHPGLDPGCTITSLAWILSMWANPHPFSGLGTDNGGVALTKQIIKINLRHKRFFYTFTNWEEREIFYIWMCKVTSAPFLICLWREPGWTARLRENSADLSPSCLWFVFGTLEKIIITSDEMIEYLNFQTNALDKYLAINLNVLIRYVFLHW